MTIPKKKTVLLWLVLLLVGAAIVQGVALIRHGFSARDTPSVLETYVARTTRKLAVPSSASNQKNPFTATAEVLAEARAHFADHCSICHGNNGSGNAEIGQNLYPKAPDMRLPQTQQMSDGEIYYIIHNGIRLTGMPAWATDVKDEASWKLVLFVRHLPRLTLEEEKEMKRLNPKGPEELKEQLEEEQFLNESQPNHQADKPTHHNH